MPDKPGITVEIRNGEPIELLDLTQSLLAFADEYNRHREREAPGSTPTEAKLFVKQMRSGSVIADLEVFVPGCLAVWESAPQIVEFLKYLKAFIGFLLATDKTKPNLERANYNNLCNLLEPIAKDAGAQITIGTVNISGDVNITLNSMQANAAQNAARRELRELREPVTGIRERVLLYWYQARNDPKSKSGDKAIVESVHNGPIKTIFANESIKAKILGDSENPFKLAYVVDIAVETIGGKPALYRILGIHDQIARDSA